jgi:hypothetical protein
VKASAVSGNALAFTGKLLNGAVYIETINQSQHTIFLNPIPSTTHANKTYAVTGVLRFFNIYNLRSHWRSALLQYLFS